MDTTAQAPTLVDVLLPARDEAAALPHVLAHWPSGLRAIVIDNGSVDDTAEVAAALGAYVVTEPQPGYGAAVHAGLLASTASVIAVMDADGSMDPRDVLRLAQPIQAGSADLAVGRRRAVERRAWPWHARAGNAVLASVLRRRLRFEIHDIGAMRVAGREAMLSLEVQDRRFGYPLETLVRAAAREWRVVELEISYSQRRPGTKSKVTGSVRGTAQALLDFRRALS